MNIYYIGGSPCSGKSTIAELIAKKYGFCYFKVDDFLEKYMGLGAEKGYEICSKQSKLSFEQIFMQNSELLCEEELQTYCEMYEFIKADLQAISSEKGIIAEGAAFLPKLMKQDNILDSRYICITPTKEFQVEHYRKREWLPYILDGCSDKEKVFQNWMDRDALFAEDVRQQCKALDYKSIVTDGAVSIEEMLQMVCEHFGFCYYASGNE